MVVYKLEKLDLAKIGQLEYEMYQEIPASEPGAENSANGLNFDRFIKFMRKQIAREYREVDDDDTPTITHIMYVDDYPVGDICIRLKLNDFWEKHSGNMYYKIRPSLRRKGYATKMLELALDECKKLGFTKVLVQASENNIGSARTIEKNGGILLREDGSRFYEIIL